MDRMQMDGTAGDLSRLADAVLGEHGSWDQPCSVERQLRWDSPCYSGSMGIAQLRSGLSLSSHVYRGAEPFELSLAHAPTGLEFTVSRGTGAFIAHSEGQALSLNPGTFTVGQVKRQMNMDCRAPADSAHEMVQLGIDPARLAELLGSSELPAAALRILRSTEAFALESHPLTPVLSRLLDEILFCDARGISRQLYLEGKGLELLALIIDGIEEAERAACPQLPAADVERLQLARQILLTRMADPLTIPQLARCAGLNEAKLKAGFKTLFGESVFGYLRSHRMKEAQRMLQQRRYSVTEVARQVGYSNPSKFSAAFRKHFGMPPSQVA